MDFVIPGLELDAIIGSEKTNMPVCQYARLVSHWNFY